MTTPTTNYPYQDFNRIEFWANYDSTNGRHPLRGVTRSPLRMATYQLDNSFAEVQRTNRQHENLALIRRNMKEEREKHMYVKVTLIL